MKYKLIFTFCFLLKFSSVDAQEFNPHIDKDSLFQVILKSIPEESRNEFKNVYEESNEVSKEFLLIMFSMPRSSKLELIENYQNKSKEIFLLKNEFKKLVLDSLVVSIEFNPAEVLYGTEKSIDISVFSLNTNIIIEQEWNLLYDSPILFKIMEKISWNNNILLKIKKLLEQANCVSIENGVITTIGFARSGMGKYYYKLFEKNLNENEVKEYNDGCTYIFYENNIVLEYGGGAIGPQCFPDE